MKSSAVLNEKIYPVPSPNGKRRPARVRAGKFLTGDSYFGNFSGTGKNGENSKLGPVLKRRSITEKKILSPKDRPDEKPQFSKQTLPLYSFGDVFFLIKSTCATP